MEKTLSQKFISARQIFWVGLLVASLDLLSAFIDYYINTGKNPLFILNYIASGLFGKSALTGGFATMLTGLLLHYLIAFSFTIFFFWLYPKSNFFYKNRIITAFVYGLFIWIIMNLIVVQLSGAPHANISAIKPAKAIKAYLILTFMIGLPLSFFAYSFFKKAEEKKSADLDSIH